MIRKLQLNLSVCQIRILKEELQRTNLELESFKERIKENQEKIKLNKQLPYLVGNIVEILEMNPENDAEEDGANIDLDSQRKGKCVVLKTSTRQTIFLPAFWMICLMICRMIRNLQLNLSVCQIRILKEELQRTNLELESFKERIKENQEKIKLNKQLPYLVGKIVEILEMNPENDAEEDGANIDLDSQRKGKCVVLKTSTRQTIFLPALQLNLSVCQIRILKEELQRTNLELESFKERIKENQEKIKLNKQLPYLVGNIVEILEMNPENDAEEDGANIDLDSQRKGKCVVLKTSTRQTIFLPAWIGQQSFNQRSGSPCRFASPRVSVVRAKSYSDELVKTAVSSKYASLS
ncbi:hypothetical protein LOK49_LG03G00446 [Camellia lanceoleosa]|uniref:Uncharacterized protein n=1 Tax=Camellia lanceoleosa TaxID=1840588 RepID=A0ACC0I5K3_9ERIC|nr:hypothetical protein LOK49_LG03G00446 [Camellia lanceoleosa]